MELLRFTVRNQRLSGGRIRLVSDSIDYVEAFFDFRTEDWEGLSKWAHFSKGEVTYDLNLAEDRITKDMHLNLDEGTWEIKLHGTDSAGTMRITTDTAFVIVEKFGEGFNPLPEIPLSAAEQIDAKAELALETAQGAVGTSSEAVEIAMEIKRRADEGEFDGEDGAPGKTPEIQIGNIETLPPEAEATVTIGGTAERPIFNFGIPKGNTGEDGIGIENIETETSAEDGGFNVLTIKLTDGRSFGWMIKNGAKGEIGKAGSPGLVWAGEWNAETSYTAIKNGQVSRDVVMYNGSAYVVAINSTAPVIGIVPEGDTSGRWALLVSKGEKGETGNGNGVPVFDLKEMGLAAIPFNGGTAFLETDTAEIADAFAEGPVKFIFPFEIEEQEISVDVIMNGFSAAGEMAQGCSVVVLEEPAIAVMQIIEGRITAAILPVKQLLDIPEEKVAASVDLSGFETEGEIVETYPDGTSVTYNFEFDSEGNPVKITDSDGNETVLTW